MHVNFVSCVLTMSVTESIRININYKHTVVTMSYQIKAARFYAQSVEEQTTKQSKHHHNVKKIGRCYV